MDTPKDTANAKQPHVPQGKPRKKNSRIGSQVISRDGKTYWVTINGNGLVGIQEVVPGRQLKHDPERLRYAEEILQWMRQSALAANKVPYLPPQPIKSGSINT